MIPLKSVAKFHCKDLLDQDSSFFNQDILTKYFVK